MYSKIENLNDRYEILDKKTGEISTVINKLSEIKHCIEFDVQQKQKKGLKKLRNIKNLIKLKKWEELFGMIKYKNENKMELTLEEKGLYETLIENVLEDGSYRVIWDCHNTRAEIAKYFGIGKEKLIKLLTNIQSKDLIYVDFSNKYGLEVYINPRYFRVGDYIKSELVSMFKIPKEEIV